MIGYRTFTTTSVQELQYQKALLNKYTDERRKAMKIFWLIIQTSTSSSLTSAPFGLSLLKIWISAPVIFWISFMTEPLLPIIQPITFDGTRSRIDTEVSSSSLIFPSISRTASTAMDFKSLGDYKMHKTHEHFPLDDKIRQNNQYIPGKG